MTRRISFACLFLVVFSAALFAQQHETLADVLKRESIPIPPASVADVNVPITSYATLNSRCEKPAL